MFLIFNEITLAKMTKGWIYYVNPPCKQLLNQDKCVVKLSYACLNNHVYTDLRAISLILYTLWSITLTVVLLYGYCQLSKVDYMSMETSSTQLMFDILILCNMHGCISFNSYMRVLVPLFKCLMAYIWAGGSRKGLFWFYVG